MAEIKTVQTEVKEFVDKLPYWQRVLLSQATTGVSVRDNIVTTAYSHVLAENKLSKNAIEQPSIDIPDFFGANSGTTQFKSLRLKEIRDIENVNAIRSKQKLTFGPNLTVVFGCNGSGKSGFARLLSTAFYSRGDRTILPNIFTAKTNDPPKATFVFQDGTDQPKEIEFPQGKAGAEFRNFAVFDSKSIPVHLNDRNEVYVSPKVLDIFGDLASLTNQVLALLDAEIQSKTKVNTLSAFFEGTSAVKSAVEGLRVTTDLEKVKTLSVLKSEEIERAKHLEIEIAKLKAQDIDLKKKELGQVKDALATLRVNIERVNDHFSKQPVKHYKSVIELHQRLQKEVEAVGAKQFEDSRFQSVGSTTWKDFLTSAQSFANAQTTSGHEHKYPSQDNSCIFCRQTLSQEAVALIEKYWQYLSGEAEKKLKTSEQTLQTETRTLGTFALQKLAADSSAAKWLTTSEPSIITDTNAFIDARISEIAHISTALKTCSWTDLTLAAAFSTDRFIIIVQKLEREITDLNVAKLKEEEIKLQTELTTLKHREKLAEYYTPIEAYVLDLRWLESARELRRKITTKAITDLQKKLHDELLNKKYKLIFHQECQELKAPYQINLEQKGVSGKTLRQLSVEGFQPGQILSEGEQRAIALADFFTEVEISGIHAGIIFDDPVNSLDHERKEVIARKLARASKNRQVVVFTHDLGFIYDLKNESSQCGVNFLCHWVERLHLDTGIVSLGSQPNLEKEYLDPVKAEQKLKDAQITSDASDRERLVREGMALLRSGYEAFTIMELFNGTVLRFDRQVKYAQLKEVHAPRALAVAIYDKLAYVSGFIEGHLHSDGYTGTHPTVQLLEAEITAYKELRQKYRSDKKLAVAQVPQ